MTTHLHLHQAVFLDRDGVLIEDCHLLTDPANIRVLPGVPPALLRLQEAGFRLIVVTNQAVVARGLATEDDVHRLCAQVSTRIEQQGGPPIDAFYICPHHPNATLTSYRVSCDCRKPRPGLFFRAAADHGLDLNRSFMVGDRVSDTIAGARAGCRTVLVATGAHLSPPIESDEAMDLEQTQPSYSCAGLPEAVNWILESL